MAVYGNMVITSAGQTVYAEVQSGSQLKFTRMQIGGGQLATSTTLNTALTAGTAYTSLTVPALSGAIANGSTLTIGTGGTTQTVTTSAYVAPGATTIPVASFTANANYVSGTAVSISPNPAGLTALITPIDYIIINSIAVNNGSAQINGLYQNTNLTQSTYTCEIGLLATDPNTGDEILYAYANAGNQGDTFPPSSDGPFSRQFQINTAIGSATNVTAVIPTDTYLLASAAGQPNGVATLDANGNVPASQLGNVPPVNAATTTTLGTVKLRTNPSSGSPIALTTMDMAVPNGVASLDATGNVPASQLRNVLSTGGTIPSGQTLTNQGTIQGGVVNPASGTVSGMWTAQRQTINAPSGQDGSITFQSNGTTLSQIGFHAGDPQDQFFVSTYDGTSWHETDIDNAGNWRFPNALILPSITPPPTAGALSYQAGTLYVGNGTTAQAVGKAGAGVVIPGPSAGYSTTSTQIVSTGFGVAVVVPPSGRLMAQGQWNVSTGTVYLYYSTVGIPAPGAAPASGDQVVASATSPANAPFGPLPIPGFANSSGLTPGTKVYVYLALSAQSGNTASINDTLLSVQPL